MRKLHYSCSVMFLLLILGLNHLNATNSNEQIIVQRGERPPVNLNALNQNDFEAGKLYLKFKTDYSTLVKSAFTANKEGIVVTGLSALDQLNQQFEATAFTSALKAVYNSNSKSQNYMQRHEAWGFHLWFEVKLAAETNILEAVQAYQSNPSIELAEPVYKKVLYDVADGRSNKESYPQLKIDKSGSERYTSNDPLLGAQWHYNNTGTYGGTVGKDISLFDAWDIEKGHSDVIVAIVDGGIQTDHEDLAGNMWSGIGYNFVDNNSTIIPHTHGTHVAGTVAAETNNSTGLAGIAGGSGSDDGVRLMSCQVFKAVEGGNVSGGFADAMIYAADNDAAISQNSWGTSPPGAYNTLVLDAIDYFNTNGGGSVLDGGITIFAAGNNNADDNYYPGYYSGVLSVAATNNRDQRSYFSNYGDYIDLSAPGGEQNENTEGGVASTDITNSYTYKQGTSMACPHVSGVAALVVSYAHRSGVTLKNDDVFQILKETTDDHYAENPAFTGKLGTGRLNSHAALLATNNFFSPTALTPDYYFGFDGTMEGWYSLATTGNKNFVWTNQGGDYGGQITSASADNGYVMFDNLNVDQIGPNPAAALLYSPVFDLSGTTNLYFTFEHKARQLGQDFNPSIPNMNLKLEASNDGFVTNVQELWSYDFPNTDHLIVEGNHSIDISALAGSPNIQFRFNYAGGGGYWWLIDDVSISSLPTPTYSLAEGYTTNQEVFISNFNDYPSGTNIYYTLDGTTPSASTTLYNNTNGIPLQDMIEPVTIYAIAIHGTNESGIGSATYSFTIQVPDIATLRSMAQDGTKYTLTGEAILTFQTSSRNAKYIQDATGAILIDDNSGIITTTYDIYDGITGIIGTLSTYQNMLQFIPLADPGSATSTGNTVTPVEVTLANLDNTYQAKLVKIIDVSNSETGNYVSGHNYSISDPSGSGVMRTAYSDLNYLGTPISEDPQDVIGVILQFQSSIQLVPRSLSDFTSLISFYFRGPSWMNNNPHNPQIWGPFNSWSGAAAMTYDNTLGWWKTTVDVGNASAVITYQSRFSQDGETKYHKAFENFGANPTFTTTTAEIWIDASEDGSFAWSGNDFYLAQDKITETQPITSEPANHVTNIAATADSESQISLTWTDSDATYYLIKGSPVGYGDINTPVDGTAEADALLVKNIGSTIESVSFSGLDAATTYYFKVFPYNGAGVAVNYKTDGSIPEASATTSSLPYYYLNAEGNGETKGSYASGTVTLSNIDWNLTEALIGTLDSDYKTGSRSIRMRGYGTSSMTMLEDKTNGIGSIYFNYRRYGTDSQVDWKVEYSTDGGTNWTQIGNVFTAQASDEVQTFHEKVNVNGNIRLRIKRETETGSSTSRLNIDDMIVTDYNTVTFLADMSLAAGFNGETDDVYISGTLINPLWGEPGSNSNAKFSRLGPTDAWINVMNLGELQYEYKLFKNTGWGNGEWIEAPNRRRSVTQGEIIEDLFSYVEFSGNGAVSVHSNWKANDIPSERNIHIKGTALIDMTLLAQSLLITNGASVTIQPTQQLTVSNNLINRAGTAALFLQSDATGTASLLHNTDNVDMTMQRYMTGDENTANAKYHTVSVPLTTGSEPLSGLFTGAYLYEFDQSIQDYETMGTSIETPLPVDQGYLIYYPGESTTFSFAGKANNGSFATAVSYPAVGFNYNLVPNPYPSAIDWDAAGWTKTNMHNAVYIYNTTESSGNGENINVVWASYVDGTGTNGGSRYIPAGQAFFVQSNAADPVLSMTNDVRVHSAQNFYKDKTEVVETLRLFAEASDFADEIVVRFVEESTLQFDGQYDALKFKNWSASPNIYSLTPDKTELSINSIPYSAETFVVELGFEWEGEGDAAINFEGIDSFGDWVTIFFEDRLTGARIDLQEASSYAFTHMPDYLTERFLLRFMGVTGNEELDAVTNETFAWSKDGLLHVYIPETMGETQIDIFDLQGRVLYQQESLPDNLYRIDKLPQHAALLVRLTGSTGVKTQKVINR